MSRHNLPRLRDRNFGSLAKDISQASTLPQALALAGADYQVGKTKLYARVSTEGSVPIPGTQTSLLEIPDARGMWRLDEDGEPRNFLGTVGTKYTPVQNEQAFEAAEVFSGQGAQFDRCYVSTDFAQVCLRMKVAEEIILGDKAVAYTTLVNTHDGTSSLLMLRGMFRFCCNNEWAGLLKKSEQTVRQRHTVSANNLVDRVRLIMCDLRASLMEAKTLAEQTVNIHLGEARWQGIVETLLPITEEMTLRQRTVVDEQRSQLHRAWRAEDLNNFRHSGWGALQAVADFSSHLGDSARMSSNPDTIVKNLLERTQQQPLLAQARDLVLALN